MAIPDIEREVIVGPEERFQLALQVFSYRGEVTWQLGDLRCR